MTTTPKNEAPTPPTNAAIRDGARRTRTSARAATKADSVAGARSIFQWMFRSRETGRITIMQRPNLALTMALAAIVVRTLLHPAGSAGVTLTVLVGVTLTVWATLEIVHRVIPGVACLVPWCSPWLSSRGSARPRSSRQPPSGWWR